MSVAPPAYGSGEAFGIAKESSYGTAISTADIWMQALSCSIKRMDDLLERGGPTGGMVPLVYNASRPYGYRGVPDISGAAAVDVDFDDIGVLLGLWLGPSVVTNNSPVSGAHTHVFTLPYAKPATTPKSATLFRDQDTTDPAALRGAGHVIQNIEFGSSADQADRPVECIAEFVGQSGFDADYTGDAFDIGDVSTAPWAEFTDTMVAWHATPGTARGSLTNQTGGKAPNSFRIRGEENKRVAPATGGTVRGIREPVWNGHRRVIPTISRDLFDEQFFDVYYAATEAAMFSALAIKMTSLEFITGSTPYSLDFYMPYFCMKRTHPDYGGGNEIVPEEITGIASSNRTAAPLVVTLVNGTSSAYWS